MRAIKLNAKNLRDIILEASRSSKGPATRKKKIKESVGEEETHVLVGQIEMAVESAAREFFDDMFSADDPSMKAGLNTSRGWTSEASSVPTVTTTTH